MEKIEIGEIQGIKLYAIKAETTESAIHSYKRWLYMPTNIVAELLGIDHIELANTVFHSPIFSKYSFTWGQTYEEGYNDLECIRIDQVPALLFYCLTQKGLESVDFDVIIKFEKMVYDASEARRKETIDFAESLVAHLTNLANDRLDIIRALLSEQSDKQHMRMLLKNSEPRLLDLPLNIDEASDSIL